MSMAPFTSRLEDEVALALVQLSASAPPVISPPFPSPLESEVALALVQLSSSAPPVIFPPYLRRRADAILNFLSGGYYSEAQIGEELRDDRTTRKALRMLFRNGEVTRSGAGGQNDPFIYTKA